MRKRWIVGTLLAAVVAIASAAAVGDPCALLRRSSTKLIKVTLQLEVGARRRSSPATTRRSRWAITSRPAST